MKSQAKDLNRVYSIGSTNAKQKRRKCLTCSKSKLGLDEGTLLSLWNGQNDWSGTDDFRKWEKEANQVIRET